MMKPTVLMSLMLLLSGMRTASADLLTRVELTQLGTTFIYTVFNDEPAGSPNYISCLT